MDDLIVYGTAGIVILLGAAGITLYGLFVVVMVSARALLSGDFQFLLSMFTVIILVISGYTATGLWLHRTNRI